MKYKYECDCGFQIKIDSEYIKQYGKEGKRCPSCETVMKRARGKSGNTDTGKRKNRVGKNNRTSSLP